MSVHEDPYEDDEYDKDDAVCHHGVGFDEECEECEVENELDELENGEWDESLSQCSR